MRSKILLENELIKRLDILKAEGKKIVSTSGCFDILHAGHVLYLEEAKQRGDILVVLLNSDTSVKRLKGESRPIIDEFSRATVLSGLECIDFVCLFNDDTPCRLIEAIKPNIVVKGGDYEGQHIPEMDVVATYGGKVEYVSMIDGYSTTHIVTDILNNKKEGE